MEEKKADNRIIEVKKEININEERLADSRKKLRGIEDLDENFSHLNKNLNICVEIINSSVKNKGVNKKINYMSEDSTIGFKRTSSSLYDEKEDTQKEIRNINDQIDKLSDEIKEIYQELEELRKEKEEKVEETKEEKEIKEETQENKE